MSLTSGLGLSRAFHRSWMLRAHAQATSLRLGPSSAPVERASTAGGSLFYWSTPHAPELAANTALQKRSYSTKNAPIIPEQQKNSIDIDGKDQLPKVEEVNSELGLGDLFSAASPLELEHSLFDKGISAFAQLSVAVFMGIVYKAWYQRRMLSKIDSAFTQGYDPALIINPAERRKIGWNGKAVANSEIPIVKKPRAEQKRLDSLIQGKEPGHYFLIIGSKGTGKMTMIREAMKNTKPKGVVICEAHPDLEVFRLRLGRALNYAYNEDSHTRLFQRQGPREGGPALDIERAMNQLEKVALKWAQKRKRPVVLVFNNIHLLNNDDQGRNMLLQLQQRAEGWAEKGICTMVFVTDDFWPFPVLRQANNRMTVLPVADLGVDDAFQSLRLMHENSTGTNEKDQILREVLSITGGRVSLLGKVTREKDMLKFAKQMLKDEKEYLLSQIGLIRDYDTENLAQQKRASSSWLLLRELVRARTEQKKARDADWQVAKAAGPEAEAQRNWDDLPLPSIPYSRCRQIMTRTDLLEDLDRRNIIAIDTNHNVRLDSMIILQAAREVVGEPGFDECLQSVRDRIEAVEGLSRTRNPTDPADQHHIQGNKSGGEST